MDYYTILATDRWEIILVGDEDGLTHLHMVTSAGSREFAIDDAWVRDDERFHEARQQLVEYFAGERRTFTVPLNPRGTEFQKRAWQALRDIPYGETRTYKEQAVLLGNPRASRAVGTANGRNPIPIIIPCHRVIGSNGSLTGFAHGLDVKQALLDLEQARR